MIGSRHIESGIIKHKQPRRLPVAPPYFRRMKKMNASGPPLLGTDLPDKRRFSAKEIHARLCDLIAEHQPSAVAVEDVFFGQNARSAFAVGQARGVVMRSAGLAHIGRPRTFSATIRAISCADSRSP